MEKKFIIALSEHRVIGYVFLPYLVELQDKADYYTMVERITNDDIRKRSSEFSEDQKKVVKLIEEYSDTDLVRFFSKKRISNQEFFLGLTADKLNNQIRPYIERRLVRIIDLLNHSSIEVFFKDSPKQIYASDKVTLEKKPAEAIFNFIRTPYEFKYFLSVIHNQNEMKLSQKRGVILVNKPCHIIVDNHLLIFNDIDGKKLSPFFRNEYVNVPKTTEKEYLEKFVLNTIQNFRVNCTGFSIIEQSPKPALLLSLEGDLQYNPVLRLSFDYGSDLIITSEQVVKVSVTLRKENEEYVFYKTNRHNETEKKAILFLQSLGLNHLENSFFTINFQEGSTSIEMLGDLINWINNNEEVLLSEGFTIIQNFYDKQYFTKKIELRTSFGNKNDWFDVYAMVFFGDYEIPFVRFRKYILNNIREYQLPNGEIVMLPKEWFSRFTDLFYFGRTDGDHILYKQVQLPVLQESLISLDQNYASSILNLQETYQQQQNFIEPNIHATLRPYQIEGFSWMFWLYKHKLGACLADDMGLGKTIQTLTLLNKVIYNYSSLLSTNLNGNDIQETNSISCTVPATLIVLPASLVHNWYNEIQKFTPELRVLKYIGTGRTTEIEEFSNYDILLTTYGVVRNEYEHLRKYEFLYVILDESQTIKNPESKIFLAVTRLKAKNRLVLTGTPIENSLTDLWSQIEFLNPGLLGSIEFFKNYFSNPIEKEGDEQKREKLKKLIQPFILRRTKKEVATDLPELNEQVLLCSMSDAQKNYYEEEKSKVRNEILHSIDEVGMEKSSMLVINALTRLRQIANHPVMIDKSYCDDSGKFEEVTLSLENMYEQGHKVLIFSSFVKHLELLRTFFIERNWFYSILTGDTHNREEVVNNFQTCEDHKFFLISLKAGGVGLNLTAADYVFILDPWWNPASEMQAINRAHRIGQTNKVFVYRFISAETIEEKIVKLQEKKSELAEIFINSNNPLKMLSKENILELLD